MRTLTTFALSLILLNGCAESFDPEPHLQLGLKYDVIIERDYLGVPHIHGKRDIDTAFGFAYAQAEDSWGLIQDSIAIYRGEAAKFKGKDAAPGDFLVKWLGVWETLDADYAKVLSKETRAYVEAYADGINYFAALHPEQINGALLPISGKDIVAGFMLRHLLFYGFDAVIGELTGDVRQREISQGDGVEFNGLPIGSNAFAVSPGFGEGEATRLAINSHQPTTGPVAWYEAHIQSDEGLNIMGGTFPGSPNISLGFTANLAWGVTVNKPDLSDVFVLDTDPKDPLRYRLDGEWLTLETRDLDIEVRLLGFLPWTVTRQGLRSKHGPVLQTEHGTYAVRYAGMGELRQVEQWMAMNKAKNFQQWRNAMRMHRFASFNFVYADREGNIMFVHNSLTPVRQSGYDWSQYLPGDNSHLIWQDYLEFDQLPQVVNPPSGYVHSANQTPFNVTAPADNPRRTNYRSEDGFPTRMTNRAHRGLQLLSELGPISEQDFFAIKHDKQYSKHSRAYGYIQNVLALKLDEKVELRYRQAQQFLQEWDFSTTVDNRHAALGVCLVGAEWIAEQAGKTAPDALEELRRCTDTLLGAVGQIDPLWGDVNRHIRGTLNLPVGGGPDTLRAIYGRGLKEDGYHTNVAGDGLYYLVSWDNKGKQQVRGVHQFGSATLDPQSPHYADQAQDYALEKLHDPLFDPSLRSGKIKRSYRPGREIPSI